MMKRMLAVCLMTMLMLSLVLAVYGEEESRSTEVVYNVSDNYTIEIPRSVSANGGQILVAISNKQSTTPIEVYVESTNYYTARTFRLVNTNPNIHDFIDYTVRVNDSYNLNDVQPDSDSKFYLNTFTGNGTINMNISVPNGMYAAGEYKDTLTYFFK